jgi:hypothetical protein
MLKKMLRIISNSRISNLTKTRSSVMASASMAPGVVRVAVEMVTTGRRRYAQAPVDRQQGLHRRWARQDRWSNLASSERPRLTAAVAAPGSHLSHGDSQASSEWWLRWRRPTIVGGGLAWNRQSDLVQR